MQDIIRKIQKALALSNNNSNAEESHTAMLLAQRLMAKHNLTVSDLPGEEPTKRTERIDIRMKRVDWWKRRLALIIDKNFRTYSFFLRGSYIGFLGLDADVKIAVEVFRFASESIAYYATAYLRNNPERRSRGYAMAIKNDYITGYLEGLKEKFERQVKSESFALVLVKDALVVQAAEEMKLKTARPINRTTANDTDAIQQGYEDGLSFQQMSGSIKATN